jgi:hypothetical protein
MAFCPLPGTRRVAFVEKLYDDQTSFVGSVTMAAGVRDTGLEISITLEERVGP